MATESCRKCWSALLARFGLWPATLYGSIKRLIEAELIEESDERPAPELDDARRRYYRLTPLGKRVLDAECDRLHDLVRVIREKQALHYGMKSRLT